MNKTVLLVFTLKQQRVTALRKIVDCWVSSDKWLWVWRRPKAPVFNDNSQNFSSSCLLGDLGLSICFPAVVLCICFYNAIFISLLSSPVTCGEPACSFFFLFVLILVSSLDMRIFFLLIFMLLYVFRYFMFAITWSIFPLNVYAYALKAWLFLRASVITVSSEKAALWLGSSAWAIKLMMHPTLWNYWQLRGE